MSQRLLRELLFKILRTDQDLTAFCQDYFPDIQRRFSDGMDRVSKTNLLFALADAQTIANKLAQIVPLEEAFKVEIEQFIRIFGEPQDSAIAAALEKALSQRETLIAAGGDIKQVNKKILALRRQQRQGAQLQEGEILANRYKLLQRIGSGGFGDVWQAYDRKLQCLVALKILHMHWMRDGSRIDRFERGARTMLKIKHDHIVRVFSETMKDRGYLFFAMEYFSGGDLCQAISVNKATTEQLLKNILEVGHALEYAHSQGIIHRDVKPHNILLDDHGSAHLTDFDLVNDLTSTGGTGASGIGTFVYAAPEQLDNASNVRACVDVYSLGMVTLSVLCRKDLPIRVIRDSVPFIYSLDCPYALKNVLRRALEWEPLLRYQTISEFCAELSKAIQNYATSFVIPREYRSIKNRDDKERTDLAQLSPIEGVWFAENGTTYCIKMIEGSMHCAYCYEGRDVLTGHVFDCAIVGDQLFGRFAWIEQPWVYGYIFMHRVQDDVIEGSWCSTAEFDVPFDGNIVDTVLGIMKTRKPNPIKAHRASSFYNMPAWAEEYFKNRMWVTHHPDKNPLTNFWAPQESGQTKKTRQ